MDPNQHLRHSAYNDYAAQVRVNSFSDYKLSISRLLQLGIGPILFREDTHFLKEIRLSEEIQIDCRLTAMKESGVRWHILHEFFKADDTLAATILVEGAWLDLSKRKLAAVPDELLEVMKDQFPRTDDFIWL